MSIREPGTTRRNLLKAGVATASLAGGAALAVHFWRREDEPEATPPPQTPPPRAGRDPAAWVVVASDGTVEVTVSKVEMGQGIVTSFAAIIADELDAEWERVHMRWAPLDDAYLHPFFGRQITAASSSVLTLYEPLREIGATLRAMMIAAAAQEWGAEARTLKTEAGAVHHPDGRTLSYGTLAKSAAALPVPQQIELKDPSQHRLIGRSLKRLDTLDKITGAARFSLDLGGDDALVGVVLRPPSQGATLARVNDAAARKIPGVVELVTLTNAVSPGIAVLARDLSSALRGRDALLAEWSPGPTTSVTTESIMRELEARLAGPGKVVYSTGDVNTKLAAAARKFTARYSIPFVPHLPMEPVSATAHVTADRCEVGGGFQDLTHVQELAVMITGLAKHQVAIETTFIGGSFGRRQFADYAAEAIEASKLSGRKVKIVWTREDDLRHDLFHPATVTEHSAALDAAGRVTAWSHKVAGHCPYDFILFAGMGTLPGTPLMWSPYYGNGLSLEQQVVFYGDEKEPLDSYRLRPFPNLIRTWALRSVGELHNLTTRECFIDELAREAKEDPLTYRQKLVGREGCRTALSVLRERAALHPPPSGSHRGFAYTEGMGAAADVSIGSGGRVRVHRVVAVPDVKTVLDPKNLEAQVESCAVFAMAVVSNTITIEAGGVREGNFLDYAVPRIDEMPEVDTHFHAAPPSPDDFGPISISEMGVPVIAAAICNGVAAATARPVRAFPISVRAG